MATIYRQFLLLFILFSFLFYINAEEVEEVSSESVDIIDDEKSCMDLYQAGKDAYLEERWQDCIDFMEKSVQVYNRMKKHIIQCRIKCTNEADNSMPTALEDVEDLHFYERTLKNTLCLLRCKKKLKPAPLFTFEEIKLFESLKAYDYLQLCFFQKNMLPQAANAAFTFLVGNPNHTAMLSNLKFYSTLPEVNINEVINKEAPNFVPLYIHGSDAYAKEDFNGVIHNFEESLIEYLRAEEECRAFCEGSFDQGWYPEFTASIAMGKLKQACEAAASYLLFFPVDETMLSNIDYYKTQPKVKKEYFKPREIMDFITNDFIIDDDTDEIQKEEDEDNEIEPSPEEESS
ncbi:hypothetical protein B566_EDAN001149 [Ephemera danica]|nr:hypothetical protein B566_EDAN001149 [Ephemera danica]